MNIFGSGLTVLSPLALALSLPAVGLLVYAYLKRGQGARRVVSSILILQVLQKRAAARRKFRPPYRFFLELLIILLLILAVAGLALKDEGAAIALLIDNSLSMSASQVGTSRESSGASVLDEALSEARSYLSGLSESTKVTLFTSSPELKRQSEFAVSASEAIRMLEEVRFAYGGDNLDSTLRQLSADLAFDKVSAFTDKLLSAQAGVDRVRLSTVGSQNRGTASQQSPLQNLAIRDIRLTEAKPGERSGKLVLSVDGFTVSPVDVRVVVEQFVPGSSGGGFSPVNSVQGQIPAGSSKTFTLDTVSHRGAYRVRLEPLSDDSIYNRITADDTAWVTGSGQQQEALLVADKNVASLGLTEFPLISFTQISPAEYQQNVSAEKNNGNLERQKPSLLVFHRNVPEEFPKTNTLFILPPPDAQIFSVGGPVERSEITRWLESHPVTSYLNIPSLSFPSMTPLISPSWGREFLATTRGTAGFLGEREGVRMIVLGFEIFPYEGKKSPVLSILTLNTAKWLLESQDGRGLVQAGVPREFPQFAEEPMYVSSSYTSRIHFDASSRTVTAPAPGFLLFSSEGNDRLPVAVNYFNSEESDLRQARYVQVSASAVGTSQEEKSGLTPLSNRFAWLALFLLLLDLVLVVFPVIRGKSQTSEEVAA